MNAAVLSLRRLEGQSKGSAFSHSRAAAEQNAKLGPMLPADYSEAREIFLEDLAAR